MTLNEIECSKNENEPWEQRVYENRSNLNAIRMNSNATLMKLGGKTYVLYSYIH